MPPSSSSRPKLASNSSDSGPISLNHAESPLTNLVRRTSSRRARQTASALDQQHKQDLHTPPIQETREDPYINESTANYNYNHSPRSSSPSHDEVYAYAYQPEPSSSGSQYAYVQSDSNNVVDNYYYEPHDSPPRRQMANLSLKVDTSGDNLLASNGLPSPLLHSHFARDSYATASISDQHSYWDPDTSGTRSSTQSSNYKQSSRRATREGEGDFDDERSDYGRYDYFVDDSSSMYSSSPSQGPALRDSWNSTATGATVRRPDYYIPNADIRGENQLTGSSGPTPTVVVTEEGIDGAERVVERSSSVLRPGPGRAPIVQPVTANFSRPVRESSHPGHAQGERVKVQVPQEMRDQKLKVLERNARRAPTPTGTHPPSTIQSSANSRQSLESVRSAATITEKNNAVPTNPQPMRAVEQPLPSPSSLYSSNYSFYQYESPVPSPVGAGFGQSTNSGNRPQSSLKAADAEKVTGPRTPQDYLQLGIQHHEANRLGESARCFERSANEGGGCGVGMLMYGLTLRHGWGCAKNERLGFKWLMKAAESAIGDLENVRTGGRTIEVGAVQTELVLAIYEVGQCFFHGWGVGKDQKMAVVRLPPLKWCM
ncbi:Mitosis inhibitor nif1 [Psilocybe cubensis]|uniref:Mitosis inhibitor nif1 n=2 Tax=Psilocybe cubensis TaxID=181762 RepID=A0ACB8HHJ6_PSICU|nr:Mitosis inhibitor nif1 [Psilocybe cubensis]KAH9487187.1 Mitosis inhibitor nif1 [Psilocybe cubensis]